MFQGYGTKAMSVECVAKYGEHIFDSKKMVVKRAESLGQVSPYTANPYSAGSSNPYSGSASGSYSGSGSGSANPYLRDPARSGPGNPYQSDTGLEDPDQVTILDFLIETKFSTGVVTYTILSMFICFLVLSAGNWSRWI